MNWSKLMNLLTTEEFVHRTLFTLVAMVAIVVARNKLNSRWKRPRVGSAVFTGSKSFKLSRLKTNMPVLGTAVIPTIPLIVELATSTKIINMKFADWLIFIAFGAAYSLFLRIRLSNIVLSGDFFEWGGIRFLKSDIASVKSNVCNTSFGGGINRVIEIRFKKPKKYSELGFHKFFRNMICTADLAIEVEWYQDSAVTIQTTFLNWFGNSLPDS